MKTQRIADRVSDLGDRTRERLIHTKMEKLDRENERLRTEVSMLRDDLGEERGALKEALKVLEAPKVTVKESRRPHVLRAMVIAGIGYVLGTRDGRERYEQIVEKTRSLSEGVKSRMQERNGQGWEPSEPGGPISSQPASPESMT
jgi:hypothetical protein